MSKYILSLLWIALLSQTAFAIPTVLNHQGKIINPDGEPVNGVAEITFTIYQTPTGNSQLWSQTIDVTFDNGEYSVELGPGTPQLSPQLLDRSALFLGVQFEDANEFEPRSKLTSVPYAFLAGTADSVQGSVDAIGGLTVDGEPVISEDGHWVGPQITEIDETTLENYLTENNYMTSSAPVIGGQGTPNRIAIFTDTDTLGDSILAEESGKLGIGTDTPNELLTLEGTLSMKTQSDSPAPSNEYGKLYFRSGSSGPPVYHSDAVLILQSDTTDDDTTVTDSSASGHSITVAGDTHHEADQARLGATSLHFDGTGDYLEIPDSDDFDFGDADFTVEAWIYPTQVNGNHRIILGAWGSDSNQQWEFITGT